MRAVKECGTQALRFTDSYRVPFGHFSDDLYVRVFVVQFCDAIEPTAVNILVRILTQHIERGANTKLRTKNVGTFGTDILTIGYISLR